MRPSKRTRNDGDPVRGLGHVRAGEAQPGPRQPDLLLGFTIQPIMFVLLFVYVRPVQVGSSARSPVSCVSVKTKTRSKNSSSGET